VAKRTPETDRRRIIEEQRKKARASERRKTVATIVLSAIIGIALIGASIYFGTKSKNKNKPAALTAVGVPADQAGCLPVKEEDIPTDATGGAKHTTDRVEYAQSPPTSGRHHPTPLQVGVKKFYSRAEDPGPEHAVHNLEHAYTVVWYDKTVSDAQIALLKQAGDSAQGKFLIVPWTRTDFPDNKHIVITAWGFRQQCSDVSGAAFADFMTKHGGNAGKAPEKGAF
jgi:hypothetical protein